MPALLVAMLIQACAATPGSDNDNGEVSGGQSQSQSTNSESTAEEGLAAAPEVREPTDPDVMYHVFAAELLGTEGDLEGAVGEYLEAAMNSNDPEVARRATRVALAAQEWYSAAMAADRWALLAPDDLSARETAAATMLATHDYAGAELQLEEILNRTEDKAEAWTMVASLLGQASDPRKAYGILERLLSTQGQVGNADALFIQSQLLARTGQFEQASRFMDQALELAPDRVDMLSWAGRLALSLQQGDKAIELFARALALDPEDHDLALAYADLLARDGRHDEARAVMDSMTQTPDVLLSRILFETAAEQPEAALELYGELAALDYRDKNEKAYFQGRAAEVVGKPEDAIEAYGSVSSGDNLIAAGIRRAQLIAEQGDIEAAREELADLRTRGDDALAEQSWLAEGQLLRADGRLQEAFEVLGLALEAYSWSTPIRYSHALLAAELGFVEVTEHDLRIVLSDEPDNVAALNALGYTLADQTDRFEEAEVLIRRAYELQPNDASIVDSMGWVAFRLGRLEEAVTFLEQAWAMDKNPEIAAHLGEVLWVSGKEEEARKIWREGLEVDSEHPALTKTLERMGVEL